MRNTDTDNTRINPRGLATEMLPERYQYTRPQADGGNCIHCRCRMNVHVREQVTLYCPEWALREQWGQ